MKIPKENLIRDCEEYKKKGVLKSGEVIEYVEFEQVIELMMEIIKYNVVLDGVIKRFDCTECEDSGVNIAGMDCTSCEKTGL